jgi:dihydroxyacetone kinase
LPRCAHSLRQVTSLEMNGLSFSLLAVRISAPQTRPERADEGGRG